MKQIVELLKLGEAGTSVEEVIGEFNQLGVGALDKSWQGWSAHCGKQSARGRPLVAGEAGGGQRSGPI